MRVLLLTIWKPSLGGIVTRVENIMARSRHSFLVLTYGDRGGGVERGVIRLPCINLPVIRGLCYLLLSTFRALFLDFDVIHAHYAVPQGLSGALIKKLRRKPLVLTVHGSDLNVLAGNPLLRPALGWTLRSADLVIAVSRYLKERAEQLGAAGEKVRVVYSGVEPRSRATAREKRVLYIGALVRQKGVDLLLRAFKELKRERPDAGLVIAGDGPEREALERLAAELELRDVQFLGYVQELDRLFTTGSVLALPSREEGLGIVLLEAMARGVPVVASRTGGIPEIVVHGSNGLLFTRGSVPELAKALAELLGSDERWSRLSRNALATARRFTWEKAVEEIDHVYEELAEAS